MKSVPHTPYFIPDAEEHYLAHARSGKRFFDEYQWERITPAMGHCKKKEVAIDAGANVGIITRLLARHFLKTYAFEPARDCYECLVKNLDVDMAHNVELYMKALGDKSFGCSIDLTPVKNCGQRQINFDDTNIDMVTVDSLKLYALDFMKLDVQGYELQIIKGAIETIKKFWPVIYVEEEDRKSLPIDHGSKQGETVKFLIKKFGYKIAERFKTDFVLIHE